MGSSVLWRNQLARMFQNPARPSSATGTPNARELAEQCEVSRRTIYRDLQSLILAGIPIEFRPELHGYQIDAQLYRRASSSRSPPDRFPRDACPHTAS